MAEEKKGKLTEIIEKSVPKMEEIEISHNKALSEFDYTKYKTQSIDEIYKLLEDYAKHHFEKTGHKRPFALGYVLNILDRAFEGGHEEAIEELRKGNVAAVLDRIKESMKREDITLYQTELLHKNLDLTKYEVRKKIASEYIDLGKQYGIKAEESPENLALKAERLIGLATNVAQSYYKTLKKKK